MDRIKTEIDIAIKGGTELRRVNKQLNLIKNEIGQVLNKSGQFVKSFANLNDQLRLANTLFNNAASGTTAYRRSIETLVKTESAYNAELNKRNLLLKGARGAQGMGLAVDPVLKSIERNRKKARPIQSTGGGFIEFSKNADKILSQKILTQKQGEKELQQALLALEIKSAKTLNEKLQIQGQLNRKTAEAVNNAKLRGQFSSLTSGSRDNIGDIKSSRTANILSERRNQFGNVNPGAGGFLGFSARADEIQKLTQAEIALSASRSLASEKIKSLASIEKRKAKTESFGANFRRFRRNRPGDRGIRQQVFQSAAIGGGFPLLFGGGPLQAAAGALGGGIGGMFGKGGGFAGSIAATAIVQTIQKAVTAISELGQALGPFTQNTEAVVNSLGLQNSVQQAQLQLIEQVEGKTAAFNAAMKLMANDIGQRGVNALKEFGENSRIFASQLTLALTKLQALTAGLLNFIGSITGINNALKVADASRIVQSQAALGDTEAKGLQARQDAIDKKTKGTSSLVDGSTIQESVQLGIDQKRLNIEKQLFAVRTKVSTEIDNITTKSSALIAQKEKEVALNTRVAEIMKTGVNKELAESLAKVEQTFEAEEKVLIKKQEQAKAAFEESIVETNNKNLQRQLQTEYEEITRQLHQHNIEKEKGLKLTKETTGETDKYKISLDRVKDVLSQGMTDAVMGLIEGTKTLGESLAGVARQLASMFLNKAFGAMFGGLFSEQGSYSRAGGFKAFQYGGVVNSPTLGMVGEGGEPEYIIPASKMDGAMQRYSSGARGGAVIPGGSHAAGTVAGGSGNAIVEYTGPILNFNGDEYVPKDAVPQIINAAAKQGATLGQSRTLNTLKNSRSSRAKIGI